MTGLDYLRARYYDSQVGTFLTEDSYSGELTDPLSQNLYSYVQNNPVNYTDPSGHRKMGLNVPRRRIINTRNQRKYSQMRVDPALSSHSGIGGGGYYSAANHIRHRVQSSPSYRPPASYYAAFGPHAAVHRPSPSYVGGYYGGGSAGQYTAYQQQQAQARAIAQRQQNIRNAYAQATGIKGTPRSKEAQNLYLNWGSAFAATLRHVCNPKTAKGKDTASSKINKSQLLAVAGIGSVAMLLLGLGSKTKNKKSTPLFGMGSYTIESPSLEVPINNGWYSTFIKTSNSTEKPSKAIFNLNITNGWQPSLNINIGGGSGTIGLSGGDIVVSGSISSSKNGVNVANTATATLGLDCIDYNNTTTYTHNGKVAGYGTGINLNADIVNGILGGYSISQTGSINNGVTNITTTQTGARTGNGSQIAAALILIFASKFAPAILPYILKPGFG